MHRYIAWSGAMPTTAPVAQVATGTATKAILQLATPSTRQIQVLSWGYSLSGAGGGLGQIELLQVDVAASAGTAHVASGLMQIDPNAPNSLLALGTAATGYNFGTLNTPTATRGLDYQAVAAAASGDLASEQNYDRDFMPDERPIIAVSKFLQVRTTFATSGTNITAWVEWDE